MEKQAVDFSSRGRTSPTAGALKKARIERAHEREDTSRLPLRHPITSPATSAGSSPVRDHLPGQRGRAHRARPDEAERATIRAGLAATLLGKVAVQSQCNLVTA